MSAPASCPLCGRAARGRHFCDACGFPFHFERPKFVHTIGEVQARMRACRPHAAEATKRERIEEESRLKGVAVEDHPGWRMWLCVACGTWHPHGTEGER